MPSHRSLAAYAVHAFTATGAVAALAAMVAAANEAWPAMFAWLGLTLIIDGADGPLARWADTKANAARYSGDIMDWVIDFVTYVFIPAYALAVGPLMGGTAGWLCAAVVLITGVFYFADTTQKTSSYHFRGFPALWNIALLFLFLWEGPDWFNIVFILALGVLTFVPIDFVHPTRVTRWRPLTLGVTALALLFAGWAVWARLAPPAFVTLGLTACAAYGLGVGFYETYRQRRPSSPQGPKT